jgi:hypothetical protein
MEYYPVSIAIKTEEYKGVFIIGGFVALKSFLVIRFQLLNNTKHWKHFFGLPLFFFK